jgi:hypothetical protein
VPLAGTGWAGWDVLPAAVVAFGSLRPLALRSWWPVAAARGVEVVVCGLAAVEVVVSRPRRRHANPGVQHVAAYPWLLFWLGSCATSSNGPSNSTGIQAVNDMPGWKGGGIGGPGKAAAFVRYPAGKQAANG